VSGIFITVEGGEGVGKSTQARRLAERLRAHDLFVLELREPGGTPIGDRIRAIVLDHPGVMISPRAELLLYEAARAELTANVIVPALERGEAVVCDRFFDSSTAYQGYARGLGARLVGELNLAATGGLRPDLTVLLTLDSDAALKRAVRGGADRIEAESSAFHRAVAEGFAAIAAAEPERVVTVDATGSEDEVAARVWAAVAAHPASRRAHPDRP